MTNRAPQIGEKTVSESLNGAISFSGRLDSGELLTGTPTVVDCNPPSPETLVFSNVAVNTVELVLNGVTVPVGEAVQFHVTGGIVATSYDLKATCATDATPPQTRIGVAEMNVIADC